MYNDCYMIIHQFNETKRYYIPTYPEEMQESISVNWYDSSILNRMSPIPAYVNTGYRSISFTVTLHREMLSHMTSYKIDIETLIKAMKACVYPRYTPYDIKAPLVTFSFGKFKVKGIIRNVSAVWRKPIVNNEYNLCDVSISIDEPIKDISSIVAQYSGIMQ